MRFVVVNRIRHICAWTPGHWISMQHYRQQSYHCGKQGTNLRHGFEWLLQYEKFPHTFQCMHFLCRLNVAPQPSVVRPPYILRLALQRLVELYRAGDVTFFYVCDQFKARVQTSLSLSLTRVRDINKSRVSTYAQEHCSGAWQQEFSAQQVSLKSSLPHSPAAAQKQYIWQR